MATAGFVELCKELYYTYRKNFTLTVFIEHLFKAIRRWVAMVDTGNMHCVSGSTFFYKKNVRKGEAIS